MAEISIRMHCLLLSRTGSRLRHRRGLQSRSVQTNGELEMGKLPEVERKRKGGPNLP